MVFRLALVALDPIPLGDLPEIVQMAERAFGLPAKDLLVDAALSGKLGVVMAIVPKSEATPLVKPAGALR